MNPPSVASRWFPCVAACGRPRPRKKTMRIRLPAAAANALLVGPPKDEYATPDMFSRGSISPVTDWTSGGWRSVNTPSMDIWTTSDLAAAGKIWVPQRTDPAAGVALFRDQPGSGLNGVPFVLAERRCSIYDPDHPNPNASRRFAAFWETPGHGARRRRDRPRTFRFTSARTEPVGLVEGVASAPAQRHSPLAVRFAFENARTFEPLFRPATRGLRTRGCWRDGIFKEQAAC